MFVIETEGLVKFFGHIKALDDLSIHVPEGISGLIGPNGAGKTTTINILAGLVKPTRGKARVLGLDVWSESLEIRRKTRFMLEGQTLPKSIRVFTFLNHVAKLCGSDREEVLKVLGIVGLKDFVDRRIESLSAGMMQRLRLAQALLSSPELIILDEPTANLDPIGRVEILELIAKMNKEYGINFLVSTHILPELEEIAGWVSIIDKGKAVIEGKPGEIIPRGLYNEYRIISSNNKRLMMLLRERGFEVEDKGGYLLVKSDIHWRLYRVLGELEEYRIYVYKIEAVGTSLEEVFRKVIVGE